MHKKKVVKHKVISKLTKESSPMIHPKLDNINISHETLHLKPNFLDKYALIFLAAAIIGLILIGSSITGFVVSQSCCFPPNCAQENLCRNVAENSQSSVSQLSLIGFVLLASSLMFFVSYARKRHF